jgi:L-alanine-DL-glutamate epimerase-like enolase superfamily enzyme
VTETRRAVAVPWRAPLRDSRRRDARPADRELTLVTLTDENGVAGYGEDAPLVDYTTPAQLAAAAASGRDVAEWDLRARRAATPLWRLLGADQITAVQVNATIGAEAPAAAAAAASAAIRQGFETVKVKVGVGDDHGRVKAVRAAVGGGVGIRLDANGAWSVREAVAVLRSLAPYGIECCEEPVHGVAAIAEVARNVPEIPVAIDESASDPAVFKVRVCTALCLKLVRCGGITGLLRDAERARAAGYELYLASTLDGPLGIAAALHAAALIRPDRPSGLATLDRFERTPPIVPDAGTMRPPAGAGLGDGLIDWYR